VLDKRRAFQYNSAVLCDGGPVIRLGRELTTSSVEVIAAALSRGVLAEARSHDCLMVDMSEVRWAYPTGIVGVLALLRYMTATLGWTTSAHFGKATVQLPARRNKNSFPAGYLNSIGFINHCERLFVDTNKTQIPFLGESRDCFAPRLYLDLRRVESGATAHPKTRDDFLAEVNAEVLSRFRRWLAEKAVLARNEPKAVIGAASALQELVTNVFDHSTTGGYAYAQQGVRSRRRYLAVVVADTGPGIHKSIQILAETLNKPEISDGEAIRLAGEKFATSKPRRIGGGRYGGGIGLSILQEVADETEGVLNVRSGNAAAHYRAGHMSIIEKGLAEYPGTYVSLYIPILNEGGAPNVDGE